MAEEPGRGGGHLRVLFWGTPLFALPSLPALGEEGHEIVGVVTQPDRPSGRGRSLTPSPVREAGGGGGPAGPRPGEARRGGLPSTRSGNWKPDLSVVVAYGHILPSEVLSVPAGGSINVHASLLPELRGAAPINWAILRGHRTTGVSIMRMVTEMDAGPVLFQIPEDDRSDRDRHGTGNPPLRSRSRRPSSRLWPCWRRGRRWRWSRIRPEPHSLRR